MESTTSKPLCPGSRDRQRSRSGCITCRKRKIKCDEAYPACRRCTSTGRACDGYGIWGGGGSGKLYGLRRPRDNIVAAVASPMSLHIPVFVASAVEKEHFDWFRYHTLSKLPGSFNSDFWVTLLPQACLSERAVLNAVLALSSVHRGRGKGNQKLASMKPVNEAEIFTLEHYLQAITHLQPYFSCRNRASLRITLIVCIVFVCIDLLRGNFNSARNHVRGGLRLIADMQQLVCGGIGNNSINNVNGSTHPKVVIGDSIDHWIMEVLSRLYIQINLCQPPSTHSSIAPFQIPSPHPPLRKFHSSRFAWLDLDRQLHRILHIASQARQRQRNSATSSPTSISTARLHQSVLADLKQWEKILKASKETLLGNGSVEYQKAYCILAMYHTMATIMAHTCVYPEDETVFDAHTDSFILLTEQATALCSIPGGSLDQATALSEGISFDTSRSIVDVGCLPQLYYTALKCRVHHVRHRAVELLQPLVHREGFWDARIAATVAKRVMEVEEGDYYKPSETMGDNSSESSLLALPGHYRLRDVEVVYSGEPFDRVLLFCRGKQGCDDKRRVCIGQYEVSSQSWVDVVEQ
ncbi:hypothetical protein EV127DRAFT_362364 [Xylaria flabelliformis]|nr:hypothetical protein EV127DRAFT_362364 [Xylaria flabelliformis]